MLAAALAMMVEVAWAEDDASHAALTHAVQRYLDGDAAGARSELQALLALGPDLPAEVRREALLWLGDLLFAEGGAGAARNVFETLLDEAPDYPIDPVAHSPEVVAYFESVRRALAEPPPDQLPPDEDPPELEPEREPWPWRSVVPFGVGYFVDKKPAAGVLIGGLQLVGLGVSAALYVDLSNKYPQGGKFPEEQAADLEAFNREAWINRSFAAAGVLSYLAPIAIETGAWSGKRRLTMAVGPTTVTLSGSF